MTMETLLFETLGPLVANRVYPGVAPEGKPPPYITYSSGGGPPTNFLDGSMPSKENARVQINVWANTIMEAKAIAIQADRLLRAKTDLSTTALTERFTRYEPDTKLHGTYQFFSCWADIPSV